MTDMKLYDCISTLDWVASRGLPRPIVDLGCVALVADGDGVWHVPHTCRRPHGTPEAMVEHPWVDIPALSICTSCQDTDARMLADGTARSWFDDAGRARQVEHLVTELERGVASAAGPLLRAYQRMIDPHLFVHVELRDNAIFEELFRRAAQALQAAHCDPPRGGRLVAIGGFDPACQNTVDEVVSIVSRRHHAPLEAVGRVAMVVTDDECDAIRSWAAKRNSVFWDEQDPGLRLEAEFEDLWLDGVGGEHPSDAYRVLQALAV